MELSNYNILSAKESVTLLIAKDAQNFTPVVLKNGYFFDPLQNGKPIINNFPRQKSLCEWDMKLAKELIESAQSTWKPTTNETASVAASKPAETIPATSSTPYSTLDAIIAKSCAELSLNKVLEYAKPLLEKHIADTYGILPQTIEVKTERETHKIEGITHHQFEKILKLTAKGRACFLTGPAGCGKNVICKQIAEALGLEFYFTNAVTQEYQITGFIDANGNYHATQFYEAFTKGGIFMLDEIDASIPETLIKLNAALANRYFDFPTGRVQAHKDFRVIAAGNTFGTGADIEYTGRYQLDAASLDRFMLIHVDYDEQVELAIAHGDKDMINFIHDFRNALRTADIKHVVSYRAIEALADIKDDFETSEAIQFAVLKGLSKDDAKMIARNMETSNAYTKAFKNAIQ